MKLCIGFNCVIHDTVLFPGVRQDEEVPFWDDPCLFFESSSLFLPEEVKCIVDAPNTF